MRYCRRRYAYAGVPHAYATRLTRRHHDAAARCATMMRAPAMLARAIFASYRFKVTGAPSALLMFTSRLLLMPRYARDMRCCWKVDASCDAAFATITLFEHAASLADLMPLMLLFHAMPPRHAACQRCCPPR